MLAPVDTQGSPLSPYPIPFRNTAGDTPHPNVLLERGFLLKPSKTRDHGSLNIQGIGEFVVSFPCFQAKLQHTHRAHPFGKPPKRHATPSMKGIPAKKACLLVKLAEPRGVFVRSVRWFTTFECCQPKRASPFQVVDKPCQVAESPGNRADPVAICQRCFKFGCHHPLGCEFQKTSNQSLRKLPANYLVSTAYYRLQV